MSTNKKDIVAGYKGIMELDLTDVREDLNKNFRFNLSAPRE